MGSHTRVTPPGFKISTCVVTSNTRHLPAPSVFACVNRGSVDTTAIVGRAQLAFKNARLCTIILLIGQCQHSVGLLLTHSEMLCNIRNVHASLCAIRRYPRGALSFAAHQSSASSSRQVTVKASVRLSGAMRTSSGDGHERASGRSL